MLSMKLSPFIVLCLYLQGSALFLLDTCVFHLSQLFLSVTKKKQPWFLRRAVLLYSSHLRDYSFFGHKIDFCNKKSNFGEILQNVVNVMLIFTVYKLYLFSVTQYRLCLIQLGTVKCMLVVPAFT